MPTSPSFDARAEAEKLRQLRALSRRHPHRRTRSRLDHYSGALLALHDEGMRAADLRRWLQKQDVNVQLSTVTRWLHKRLDERKAHEQPRY